MSLSRKFFQSNAILRDVDTEGSECGVLTPTNTCKYAWNAGIYASKQERYTRTRGELAH